MTCEFTDEDPIPIRKAPEHFPKQPNGKKINIATIYRWVSTGATIKGGTERIKLEVWKVGGRSYTTVQAIKRFIRRLNGEDDEMQGGIGAALPPNPPMTPSGRSSEIENATQKARKIVHSSQNAIRRGPTCQSKRSTPHGASTGIAYSILPPHSRVDRLICTELCSVVTESKAVCHSAAEEFMKDFECASSHGSTQPAA